MKSKSNTIKINKFIMACIILLFCLIIGRLAYVALSIEVDDINLTSFAKNRDITKKTLYADRGTIYDVSGEELAKNTNSYTVIAYLDPSRTENEKNPKHVVDKEKTAAELSKILLQYSKKMTKDYIVDLLSQDLYQVELGPGGREITELVKNQIEKLDLPGISFTKSSKRYYKNSTFAPYIIGYAQKNDDGEIVGKMGIEMQYNETLKGKDGFTEYQKDILGYQIPNTPSRTEQPTSGSDIYLTIDGNIQLMVDNAINKIVNRDKIEWITISIADAKTGAILASGSSPTFDLNKLEIEKHLNPLVSYQYEPGSTMKIFSYMAAMEHGKYNGDEKYKSGAVKIGEHTISDWNTKGWGYITYDRGFIYSSNIAAANLAKAVGKDKLKEFYKRFGFGSKTGIDLPGEVAGAINFNYDIEVATASFGQGITTTPIQTIQALTSIANDGIMIKPYIIDKIVNDQGEITFQGGREELGRVAKPETVKEISRLMYDVVHSGITDARHYQPENTKLIGKTGTAEIANGKGGYLTGKNEHIRSFAGLFPKEDPQYIIYYSVKKYTGRYKTLANEIAGIVDSVAKKDDSINENIAHTDQSKLITMKNYISSSVKDTKSALEKLKVTPVILGSGDIVINQYPLKGVKTTVGNKIFILTNKKDFTMPNVKGWSTNEIITMCNLIGLKYEIESHGTVKETNFETNSKIDLNKVLKITLEK